jgi:hypothetical protein
LEAGGDALTVVVTDDERQSVGDPVPETVADIVKDPELLVDEETDTLRVAALEGESEDEVETECVTLLVGHADAVPQRVGEPDIDAVADGQNVSETLEVGDTDALRVAALDGDSDDEVETDRVALLVGDEEAVKHRVGEPDTETEVEELYDTVPLVDGDADALRDAAFEGDEEEVRQSDDELVGEDDSGGEFVLVDETDTDVEGDNEPLVLGVADDVRHPEGDTVGVSDEELQ